jgi:hypothetical protein
MTDSSKTIIADDLLRGAEQIRDVIGAENIDQVYYAARKGLWPIARIGKTLVASRAQLERHYRKITAGTS